jgi:trigger factor
MKKKLLLCMLAGVLACSWGCGKKEEEYQEPDYSAYIESLGQYKGLSYTEIETEPSDEDVQNQMDQFLSYYGEKIEVTDRAVQEGDTVNIDYIGYCDGAEIPNGNTLDSDGNFAGTDLVIGSNSYIDGFEEQLIGANIGDEVTVEVTFPDNYSKSLELQGKAATFEVTINNIYESKVPDELTDEMVSELTDDYDTVEDLEAAVRDTLRESNEEDAKTEYINELMDQVIDGTTFNGYDEDTYNAFLESCRTTDEGYAEQFDYDNLEDYVKEMYGYESMEAYEADLEEKCEYYTKKKMVIYEIVKAENIEISDTALTNYENELVDKYGYSSKDALLEKKSESDIRYDFLAEQVYSLIFKNANVE